MKILVVDDEHSINDLVVMNLKLAGYECLQAFDGAHGQGGKSGSDCAGRHAAGL